jgi:RNA polymerase sigma factor (TIGR02999 family)
MQRDEPRAGGTLFPEVYDELRRLAAHRLAQERPGQTLDATALVHEAYLRIVGEETDRRWDGRAHFFAAAAEAMRRILVEAARRNRRIKHGGNFARQPVDLDRLADGASNPDLLDLHEALEQLSAADPLKAKVVELRYFAGLPLAEVADCLGISPSTADRAWRYARAWLYAAMDGPAETSRPAGESSDSAKKIDPR